MESAGAPLITGGRTRTYYKDIGNIASIKAYRSVVLKAKRIQSNRSTTEDSKNMKSYLRWESRILIRSDSGLIPFG